MVDMLYQQVIIKKGDWGINDVPFVTSLCLLKVPYLEYQEKAAAGALEWEGQERQLYHNLHCKNENPKQMGTLRNTSTEKKKLFPNVFVNLDMKSFLEDVSESLWYIWGFGYSIVLGELFLDVSEMSLKKETLHICSRWLTCTFIRIQRCHCSLHKVGQPV